MYIYNKVMFLLQCTRKNEITKILKLVAVQHKRA